MDDKIKIKFIKKKTKKCFFFRKINPLNKLDTKEIILKKYNLKKKGKYFFFIKKKNKKKKTIIKELIIVLQKKSNEIPKVVVFLANIKKLNCSKGEKIIK